jgi:RNA polymerase sigma factor FliA
MGQDEDFVREHQDFVRKIAAHARAELSLTCELEDLIGFGFQGLLEARTRFDASLGVPFRAYAHYRVRGAVLDGVRKMGYLPRRAYARSRAAHALDEAAEHAAEERANAELKNVRSNDAQRLRAIDGILGQLAAAYTVANAAEHDLRPPPEQSPESQVLHEESLQLTHVALEQLPERERVLLRGLYWDERTLEDVGAELGLSKSWMSRLHARALARVRVALAPTSNAKQRR